MCDVAEERDAQLQSGAEPEQTSAAGSPPRGELMSPPRGLTLAATSTTETARSSKGEFVIYYFHFVDSVFYLLF